MLKNLDEAVFMNNMMMGSKDYYDSGSKDYYKALVYMYFAGERFNIPMFTEGLGYEFDNVEKTMPNRWRFCFGYDDKLNKEKLDDPIEVAELIFIKTRKNVKIMMLNHKIKALLSDSKIDDFTKARIMALLHHAGIKNKYMSKLRNEIISRSIDAKVLWILTGDGRFHKDEFARKYWAWLLYDQDDYDETLDDSEI